MIEQLTDHINSIRASGITIYGAIYLSFAITLLIRGFRQRPFVTWKQWWRIRFPVIPGRMSLGIFFLFATHREWDTAFARVRFGGGRESADHVNDWNSVIPLLIGCAVGIWAAIRLARNDAAAPLVKPEVVALERAADASERMATSMEQIAEQGANGKLQS